MATAETERLQVRTVPAGVPARFRARAAARGMTPGEYLVALIELHAIMLDRLNSYRSPELAAILAKLGLGPVTV